MASGRLSSRAAPAAAAGCLLAASAPLFATAPGAARQPAPRSLAASASVSAGPAPEAAAATSSAGLVALGGLIGAAGAALAGRTRGAGARHSSRCISLTAEGEAAPEAPKPEAAAPREEPAAPKKEEAPKAEPAPVKEEKAPGPPAPAAAAAAEKAAPAAEKAAPAAEPAAPAAEKAAPAAEPAAPAAEPAAPAAGKVPVMGFMWNKQIGITEPLGFWDPAGFSTGKGEEVFRKYRTSELKHGRVAMMAALGGVVQHFITFPGFDEVPRGIGAPFSILGGLGFIGLLGASYVLETDVWEQDPAKEIGDFGDPLNLNQYTEEMRNKELNNGRFAMFAAIGIIIAENETGKDAIEQIFGI